MPMALTQSTPAPGSAKPLIVGYPHPLDGIEDFMDDFDRILHIAVADAETWARNSLRSQARRVDGWKDIADYLDVQFDGEGFSYLINGDEKVQALANSLEYGDDATDPTAFLRKTSLAHAPIIGQRITQMMNGEVPSA